MVAIHSKALYSPFVGLSDPYVTFQIKKFRVDIKGRQKKVQKTSVKKQTLDPTWDFECFPLSLAEFLTITDLF